MPFDRASGILLHPTSFPGPHGVGDLGDAAFRFVDWLQAAGQRYWQVLPLVPVGPGHSPYASVSALAGNPLLISLPWLVGDGLLEHSDLENAPWLPPHTVDYDAAAQYKSALIRVAFERCNNGASPDLSNELTGFLELEAGWIDDFALFMAVKNHHHQAGWTRWPSEIAFREPEAMIRWHEMLARDVRYYQFEQFLFRRQWSALKSYANERGIQIIGDIPIFVAHDSADVWGSQSIFRLDERGNPTVVAGVPPDYFSATGQLWGNPHYDWSAMAAGGFDWWIQRFRGLLALVDVVRIDHFRGFAASWVVPSGDPTAATGRWEQGPGRALFDAIRDALGDVPIIVEDLGLITNDVKELRRALGLPGMAVLQFAFGGDSGNAYLPHNYEDPIVVYPGTHDNQTTIGWFAGIDDRAREHVRTYLGHSGADIAWDFLRLALASTAKLAIFTLQDALRLDDSARMNTPGTAVNNWTWRYSPEQLDPGLAAGISVLVHAYGRSGGGRAELSTDPFDYTALNTGYPLHR